MSGTIKLNLKVWRQKGPEDKGRFVDYVLDEVSPDMSFLEMLDVLNQRLIKAGDDPISFDHDCREGICGSCAMTINGNPHGPDRGTTVCQLHMRRFSNGDTLIIEPFRASAFPVIKDLSVNRSAFDRIIEAGGFVSVNTGNAQDANNITVQKQNADLAFSAAECIGCGACVAACVNSSAMLFVGAKVSHLALLPQGQVEGEQRVLSMVNTMEKMGFGNCSNTGACSVACPKEIKFENIVRMNKEYIKASVKRRD